MLRYKSLIIITKQILLHDFVLHLFSGIIGLSFCPALLPDSNSLSNEFTKSNIKYLGKFVVTLFPHHLPLAAMHRGSNLRVAKGKMEMWCPLLKMMRIQDGDIRALNPVQECLWSTGPVACSVESFSINASTTYISHRTAYHLPWNICSVYVSVIPRNCDFHEGTHHTLIFSEVL